MSWYISLWIEKCLVFCKWGRRWRCFQVLVRKRDWSWSPNSYVRVPPRLAEDNTQSVSSLSVTHRSRMPWCVPTPSLHLNLVLHRLTWCLCNFYVYTTYLRPRTNLSIDLQTVNLEVDSMKETLMVRRCQRIKEGIWLRKTNNSYTYLYMCLQTCY